MKFEVGKCYQHTTGQKIRMIAEVNTYFYGEGLLGETDDAEYIICGINEANALNYHECEDFALESKRGKV